MNQITAKSSVKLNNNNNFIETLKYRAEYISGFLTVNFSELIFKIQVHFQVRLIVKSNNVIVGYHRLQHDKDSCFLA